MILVTRACSSSVRVLKDNNRFRPTSLATKSGYVVVRSSVVEEKSKNVELVSVPFPPLKLAKRVVLVRHGQSTWNAEGRIQGSSDFSVLTKKGEAQAETSRQMLIHDNFDACFASPLARSKRTAEIIWGTRHQPIIPEFDLREIDLYSFQGLLKHEGNERFGSAFRQWQVDAANFIIDDHYPVRELWERARSCWTKILAHDSSSILVVAHNAVNQALLATAIGLEAEYFRTLLQSNCGVSVLDFTPKPKGGSPHICLNRLNQTPGSPVAGAKAGGREASKQIILVCNGSTQRSTQDGFAFASNQPMNMLGVIQVQEAADCLGADCVPRYVEMKQMGNLDIEPIFKQSKMDISNIPPFQPGWLNKVEDEFRTTLWDESGKAWHSLLDEISDESSSERVVVAVGHPVIHIAIMAHCLNLTKEWLGSFHLDAGSVSILDFPDGPKGRGVIRCINYTAHLGRWSIPITRSKEDVEES